MGKGAGNGGAYIPGMGITTGGNFGGFGNFPGLGNGGGGQQPAAPPPPPTGTNPNYPNLPPNASGSTLNPGDLSPYSRDPFQLLSPPPAPGPAYVNNFLPSVFRDPYLQGMNAAQQSENFAAQALPAASGFQQALYSPGMTPMEQQFLGASGDLGMRALSQTQANLAGMFENSASSSGLAPAMLNAANQFGEQMNQMAGQMGTQRQNIAAQMMPFTYGFPIQAAQASQQSAEGLYNMGQAGLYGDLQFPLAMFGSQPFAAPTVVAQPPAQGGGGKK